MQITEMQAFRVSGGCRTGLKEGWSLLVPFSLHFFFFPPPLLLPHPFHISIDAPAVGGLEPPSTPVDPPLFKVTVYAKQLG